MCKKIKIKTMLNSIYLKEFAKFRNDFRNKYENRMTDYPFKHWNSLYTAIGHMLNVNDCEHNLYNFYKMLLHNGDESILVMIDEMIKKGFDKSEGLNGFIKFYCSDINTLNLDKDILEEIIMLFIDNGAKIDTSPIFSQEHGFKADTDLVPVKSLLLYILMDHIDMSVFNNISPVSAKKQDCLKIMQWQIEKSHTEEVKNAYLSALLEGYYEWLELFE